MNYQQATARTLFIAAAVTVLIGLLGAGSAQAMEPDEMVGQEVYTLTNLRPDEQNQRLYTVNYQQPGRLKICTKVKIEKISRKKMIFRIAESGRKYEYLNHRKSTPEGFDENIKKYFGPECPQAEIDAMSAADKEGIKQGRTKAGMTRRGVILAIGYPPEHVTPDLEYDEWAYWMNKFVTRRLVFGADGKVSQPLAGR